MELLKRLLLCVSRKQNREIMMLDYIDRVVIVDDSKNCIFKFEF